MRPIQTNDITREDLDKIKNLVHHEFNPEKYELRKDIIETPEGYRIDGIAHLTEDVIEQIQEKEYLDLARTAIEDTFFSEDKKQATRVKLVSCTKFPDDELPVYDISMRGANHYFFANNILVHNTDSCYFSAKKPFMEAGIDFDWNNRDNIISLYVMIGQEVGKTFPPFMMQTFNTSEENGKIIDADLEMIGSRGLFLKKKRYGILKYWEDGFRLDVKGKPGKLKAMGVEIKRSDTPKYIQVFLEDVFISLLKGDDEKVLRDKVLAFKRTFKDNPSWTKGTPKSVKNLTNKTEEYEETGKCGVGHVTAAINWNNLRSIMQDITVPEITDGDKTIVCKLLPNQYRMTSIGYPTELMNNLPTWFTSLPFDDDLMSQTILRQKLDNIFGILNMNLGIDENVNTTFDNTDMFDWN